MSSSNTRRVALDMRKRTETSCDICKTRKQKCDRTPGRDICRYCRMNDLRCTVTQVRKKRFFGSIEGLGTRIELLESLVKGLVPEADLSSNDEMRRLGASLGIPLPAKEDEPVAPERRTQHVTEPCDEVGPLLPDQQGQVQYTGPSSSFSFHLKLRALFENHTKHEFVLFGPNAAEQVEVPDVAGKRIPTKSGDYATNLLMTEAIASPSDQILEVAVDLAISDELLRAYFDQVHPDFPVLHESSFRAAYETWSRAPSYSDKALMLAALHLHNTNHRDACWNLTGVAIRIAHAIGLHSDDVRSRLPPLTRELRKSLWWTLFEFEQLQISSYDRPSAIDFEQCNVSCPDERIVGLGSCYPPELTRHSTKLTLLLASSCRARKRNGNSPANYEASGPLSPSASTLRDLLRWYGTLPSHLKPEATHSTAPCYVRPILLLQAQYLYTTIVLTRSALLQRVVMLSSDPEQPLSEGLLKLSEACRGAGRALCRTMLAMNSHEKFNPFTWFDVFYSITAALSLLLDIVCAIKQQTDHTEPLQLLHGIANLAESLMSTYDMPGTLSKWSSLITELASMAQKYCANHHTGSGKQASSKQAEAIEEARLLMDFRQGEDQHNLSSSEIYPDRSQPLESSGAHPQSAVTMDEYDFLTAAEMHEWHWDDIEAMLNM
ncbi:hypothetical protein LTR53_005865 [Teratosphaeriaceae sp. CCFEE 6253]|nr:hypothetical protein LTR53_005865 [Teratosphaeriaceae sp. CCFEE 6253]